LLFGFGRGLGTRCLSPGRGALGVERLIGTQIRRSHDGGGIHGSAEKRDTRGSIRLLKSAPEHWLLGLGTGFQRRRALNLPLFGGFLATLAGLEQNLGVTPCPRRERPGQAGSPIFARLGAWESATFEPCLWTLALRVLGLLASRRAQGVVRFDRMRPKMAHHSGRDDP
jgi:hypothetical protein